MPSLYFNFILLARLLLVDTIMSTSAPQHQNFDLQANDATRMDNLEKLSILIIDDDTDDLFITSEYLKPITFFDLKIETEINYKKAEERINRNEHDIYFVDYLLGPHTGTELIASSIAKGNRKPFILLTGKGYRTVDMEGARSGAYDYLVKSEITTELLERSIRYSLQRYKAYMSLLQSETRYREIFNKSKDTIFLANAEGKFIDFNEAMPKALGYTREELLTLGIQDLVSEQKDNGQFFTRLGKEKEITDAEIELVTKEDEKKYFIASAIEISGTDGSVLYQGLLHDYTLRKNTERENVLNEKIGAVNRLVRSLAHEIRNPLTNINLAVEQLNEDLHGDHRSFLEIVSRNSNRINNLITELTNISQSEIFKGQTIDLRELADKTLEKATDSFELNGIKSVKNYPAEPVMVKADADKLQMAFFNIIINAIEATEKGKGVVELEIRKKDNTAIVSICDNGCGISAEAIPFLFEPYFTGKKHGMGIGLATAHVIIKLHKGTIEVKSQLGKGSEFIIKLPAA
jgi:PAS domain S-box-containing protein